MSILKNNKSDAKILSMHDTAEQSSNTVPLYGIDTPTLKTKKDSKAAIISFITAIVPVIFLPFPPSPIFHSPTANVIDAYKILCFYYMTIGLPILAISIITGVSGIKTSIAIKSKSSLVLAIIGLTISSAIFISFCIFFFNRIFVL